MSHNNKKGHTRLIHKVIYFFMLKKMSCIFNIFTINLILN